MTLTFQFNRSKAIAALLFLASQKEVERLDRYKASKLLFLADKLHLVQFGRPITGDLYKALQWGPIPGMVLDALSELESGNFYSLTARDASEVLEFHFVPGHDHPCLVPKAKLNDENLSRSDLEVLSKIATRFGHATFDELFHLTHATPAYRKAWANRGTAAASRMDFQDFFQEDPDVVEGVLEEVVENNGLRQALTDR